MHRRSVRMRSNGRWKMSDGTAPVHGVPMPDVNTLIAAAWPNHIHHSRARAWFERETARGWATCPLVQSGFLRISMNTHVVGRDLAFADAVDILARYTADPGHVLWEAEPPPAAWPAWLRARVQGYRQVTDATLIATARGISGRRVPDGKSARHSCRRDRSRQSGRRCGPAPPAGDHRWTPT